MRHKLRPWPGGVEDRTSLHNPLLICDQVIEFTSPMPRITGRSLEFGVIENSCAVDDRRAHRVKDHASVVGECVKIADSTFQAIGSKLWNLSEQFGPGERFGFAEIFSIA